MAESQVKSREAKLDFDEDVLAGEKAKTPNSLTRNEIFDISFRAGFKVSNIAKEPTWL